MCFGLPLPKPQAPSVPALGPMQANAPSEKPENCPLCGMPGEWRKDAALGWGSYCGYCKGLTFNLPDQNGGKDAARPSPVK